MLRAEATASGVAAISSASRSVAVEATDWQPDDGAPSARGLPDATIDIAGGVATALRFPPGTVTVDAPDVVTPVAGSVCDLEAGAGRHLVRVESAVTLYVAFEGEATLDATGPAARLDFGGSRAVTVGVAGRESSPLGTVVVPRTPAGVATALSTLPAAHLTASPDRSRPDLRGRPPRVTFGEETDVPKAISSRLTETDVSVRVPPDLRYLFTVAPLTHYLGATVSVEADEPPRLTAPGVERTLGTLPGFQYEAAQLLRRAFFFDCLVRSRLPDNEEIVQSRLLDRLALDAGALAAAPPGERLAAYLDAPFELVSPDLPDWHLSMYLEPTYDHVRTLPHFLGNLPNVFLPETRPLDGDERLTRSLDDFYRAAGRDVSTVDPVKPLLGPGQAHGWLAEGVPIDVFKSLPEAYENRRESAAESASVAVVLNDAEMADEHDHAADIYRRGTADLDITVDVRSHLSREELADVLERDHEMVHYIGHCEAAGLRCPDGHLSTGGLARSGAETFFLNACGSYFEGLELVRKGSVAGAVTFERVLDAHAARVGTTFVRLLVDGFSIERALELARRRIIMGNDYAVIGDGTHRLSGAAGSVPVVASIDRDDDDGSYRVTFDSSSPRTTGDVYQPPAIVDERAHLTGSQVTTTVSADDIDPFLDALGVPVVFDGDLQWADDLRESL